MPRFRSCIALAVIVFGMASTGTALAAPGTGGLELATDAVYSGGTPGSGERNLGDPSDPGATGTADPSGLPFTGFLAPTLLLAGLAALALGAATRRAASLRY